MSRKRYCLLYSNVGMLKSDFQENRSMRPLFLRTVVGSTERQNVGCIPMMSNLIKHIQNIYDYLIIYIINQPRTSVTNYKLYIINTILI